MKKVNCAVTMANSSQDSDSMEKPKYHSGNDSCLGLVDESLGGHCSHVPASGPSPSSSVYYSARIQTMFSCKLEYEIEASKVHWSELDPTSDEEIL